VMMAVPADAMSIAVIAAVNCELLINVVVRFEPFHCTVELPTKLVPFTVSVKAGPPAVALFGLRVVTVGAGPEVIGKFCAFDVPPPGPGLTTVTLAVPAVAMSAAAIAAVNCVAEINVVVRFDPFHCTVDVVRKLLPVTVNVNAAPPAVALAGLRLLIEGTGFWMVNVSAAD